MLMVPLQKLELCRTLSKFLRGQLLQALTHRPRVRVAEVRLHAQTKAVRFLLERGLLLRGSARSLSMVTVDDHPHHVVLAAHLGRERLSVRLSKK